MHRPIIVFLLVAVAASPAAAQTNPAAFDTVYNIGNVEPGSIFDITDADIPGQLVRSESIGDNRFVVTGPLEPADLTGDTLLSHSQLNLFKGGEILRGFNAGPIDSSGVNIEVNIRGGAVGPFFEAVSGSTVNISEGHVSGDFNSGFGSTVNVSGGFLEGRFIASSGSAVNISGGNVNNVISAGTLNITGGSVANVFNFASANITGGVVGSLITIFGSTVNISGGILGDDFFANSGSQVNLRGTEFFLDGVPLTDLVIGQAFTVTDRNVTLSGLLRDGNAFDLDLTNAEFQVLNPFSTAATLTVTLVPEPTTAGLLVLASGMCVLRRRR